MTSWVTWSDYDAVVYGCTDPATFDKHAAAAAAYILQATHWRAADATDADALEALAACQSALLASFAEDASQDEAAGGGTVASANNDGYSESYADRSSVRTDRQQRNRDLLLRYLGGPATSWMLYAGGTCHPRGRCPI